MQNVVTVEAGLSPNVSSFEHCPDDMYPRLKAFSYYYYRVHVYLSLILCIFGICLNALNVVVLCQKHMRNSSNLLLSCLAVSDCMVMVIYIIYDLGFRLVTRLENGLSKENAYLLLTCIIGQNLFHTFSTWTIVVLAAYRLLYIHAGPQAKFVCAPIRAWLATALVALLSVILTIPIAFAHEVTRYRLRTNVSQWRRQTDGQSEVVVVPSKRQMAENLYEVDYVNSTALQTILFYNSALLVKAIPILLMCILSIVLIKKIRVTQLTRRRLLPPESLRSFEQLPHSTTECSNEGRSIKKLNWFFFKSCGGLDSCWPSAQPTKMLLAVALMYVVTYLPQSVMLILNRYMGRCFQVQAYEHLGDFLDLLTLGNNGITFVIYCVMSTKFRNTFVALLSRPQRKLPHL